MNICRTRAVLAFLLLPCMMLAQEPSDPGAKTSLAPKYSNEFLKIGIGARAFGMGSTQAAIANDVTAGYWNPAGLAAAGGVAFPEVALMHAAYFANIAAYNYAGFAMPVDSAGRRRFAATLIRMGVDDIPNTLQLVRPDGTIDYGEVSSFSETQLAALLSYAWQVEAVPGLSLGTNVKIIYRGVGRFANAWGFGLDLAAHYRSPANGRFQAGLVLLDATNTFNAWTFNTETFEEAFLLTGNEVPQYSIELTRPALRTGLAYDFALARRLSLLVSADADLTFDGARSSVLLRGGAVSLDPRLGLELAYLNSQYRRVAFLRAGMYNIQRLVDIDGNAFTGVFPTAGVGVVLKNFQLDYALANIGNLSENLHSHVVSLKFHIQ